MAQGIVWWGAESARAVPGGLEHRSLEDLLAQLSHYGFNAIKLPFLHQHVLFDDYLPASSFDARLNPMLTENGRPLKYVAMLRALARRAATHGITVWLVAHSLEGLWYSRSISEMTVLDSWTSLARQLCPQWNIVGVDLKNRPWAASWGRGRSIDWDKAAARLGDHVNSKCPRWMIGVEGVGEAPGAHQEAEMEFAAMFNDFHHGENLVGARSNPVVLRDRSRLVYMPHSYGPGVRRMPYMESDEFPENTEQVWEEHFLFLRKRSETRQPAALILQIGGPYEGSPRDRAWQDWALKTAAARGLSLFYDGLNPRSGIGGESPFAPAEIAAAANPQLATLGGAGGPPVNNTGGLFLSSFQSVHPGKLHALSQLPGTRVATILRSAAPPPPRLNDDDDDDDDDDPAGGLGGGEHTSSGRGGSRSPPRPPPAAGEDEDELPVSPSAIAMLGLVLLALAGQLGCFRRLCVPLRGAFASPLALTRATPFPPARSSCAALPLHAPLSLSRVRACVRVCLCAYVPVCTTTCVFAHAARLDAVAPGTCGLLWALLGVPALPSPELGAPMPLPRSKPGRRGAESRAATADDDDDDDDDEPPTARRAKGPLGHAKGDGEDGGEQSDEQESVSLMGGAPGPHGRTTGEAGQHMDGGACRSSKAAPRETAGAKAGAKARSRGGQSTAAADDKRHGDDEGAAVAARPRRGERAAAQPREKEKDTSSKPSSPASKKASSGGSGGGGRRKPSAQEAQPLSAPPRGPQQLGWED